VDLSAGMGLRRAAALNRRSPKGIERWLICDATWSLLNGNERIKPPFYRLGTPGGT